MVRGYPVEPEVRRMDENGKISRTAAPRQSEASTAPWSANEIRGRRSAKTRNKGDQSNYDSYPPESFRDEPDAGGITGPRLDSRIFLFGVSRDKVEASLAERGFPQKLLANCAAPTCC